MNEIRVTTEIAAPPERVFAFVSDHETFLTSGALTCTLQTEGPEQRNGVGAVRLVQSSGITFTEEIRSFEPDVSYEYVITTLKGPMGVRLPVKHERGWVELTPEGSTTKVVWGSRFRVDILFGRMIERQLGKELESAFGQILERARRVVEAQG